MAKTGARVYPEWPLKTDRTQRSAYGIPMAGKLYNKTHACPRNGHDARRMADALTARHGLDVTDGDAEVRLLRGRAVGDDARHVA